MEDLPDISNRSSHRFPNGSIHLLGSPHLLTPQTGRPGAGPRTPEKRRSFLEDLSDLGDEASAYAWRTEGVEGHGHSARFRLTRSAKQHTYT